MLSCDVIDCTHNYISDEWLVQSPQSQVMEKEQAQMFSVKVDCIHHPNGETSTSTLVSAQGATGCEKLGAHISESLDSARVLCNTVHRGSATLFCKMKMSFTLFISYFLFIFD